MNGRRIWLLLGDRRQAASGESGLSVDVCEGEVWPGNFELSSWVSAPQ